MTKINVYRKRPLMRAFLFLCAFLFTSCAQLESLYKKTNPIIPNSEIKGVADNDYVAHLKKLDKFLKNNPRVKYKRMGYRSRLYLNEVFKRVVSNNELLLPQDVDPEFNLIVDRIPYIFSFPGYKFYFSTGLIRKFLKNESLLLSALTFEIIKSGRNIFEKKRILPVGIVTAKQALGLTKVDFKSKLEIYRWTYFALRRAEYDAAAILNWIQLQNKNSVEFSWLIRDPQGVTREESSFKSFLVGQGVEQFEISEVNSSQGFYKFRDSI